MCSTDHEWLLWISIATGAVGLIAPFYVLSQVLSIH